MAVSGQRRKSIKFGILMQFMGLTDKKGEEIYEGDIVRNSADKTNTELEQIVFERGMFCFGDWQFPLWKGAPNEFWEVIGNIYESSDLLLKI